MAMFTEQERQEKFTITLTRDEWLTAFDVLAEFDGLDETMPQGMQCHEFCKDVHAVAGKIMDIVCPIKRGE
jgi:hypothetical protein